MTEPMTLEKAKEILSDIITFQYSASRSDEGDAIKLGLQAINRLESYRRLHVAVSFIKLPGED